MKRKRLLLRASVLLEALVSLGIVSVAIAGAVFGVAAAVQLEEQDRRARALDRLAVNLRASISEGWRESRVTTEQSDGRTRLSFCVECEGIVTLVSISARVDNAGLVSVDPSPNPELPAGLVDEVRPVGLLLAAAQRAPGASSALTLEGGPSSFVADPLEETSEGAWNSADGLDGAELADELSQDMTNKLLDARSSDLQSDALDGLTGNGNGVLERPIVAPPEPRPFRLTAADLTAVAGSEGGQRLAHWYASRLGEAAPNKLDGPALVTLAARAREARLATRRLRDESDPYRHLGWRVRQVTLRARADEPSALDLDHAELVIELFEQVLEARRAAVGSPVVMTLRVEVGP